MKISEYNKQEQIKDLEYEDLTVGTIYEIIYEQSGLHIGKLCLLIKTDDGCRLLIPSLITKYGHYCAITPREVINFLIL